MMQPCRNQAKQRSTMIKDVPECHGISSNRLAVTLAETLASQKSKEWNEQNKERKRQSGIEYREKNKEVLQQKAKERYEKNKEQIKERVRNYGQEKVECECGSVVRKADISKHTKTKKHQEYVSKTKTEV